MRCNQLQLIAVLTLATIVPSVPVMAAHLSIQVTTSAQMKDVSGTYVNQLLYRFDLPSELQSVRIDRAVLRLPMEASTQSDRLGVRVSPVGTDWGNLAGVVAYQNLDKVDSVSVAHFLPDNLSELTEFDITEMVTSWVSGKVTNLGLIIESLGDRTAELGATSSTYLPQGAKAVVDVWFTATTKK